MANFAEVNKAIKTAYPNADIQAVRFKDYVFFEGVDGWDNIRSVYSHPTSTPTESMSRLCMVAIDDAIQDGILTVEGKQVPNEAPPAFIKVTDTSTSSGDPS